MKWLNTACVAHPKSPEAVDFFKNLTFNRHEDGQITGQFSGDVFWVNISFKDTCTGWPQLMQYI